MTPIQTWQFLLTKKLDHRALMVLELLSKFEEKTMTTNLVNEAHRVKVASHATSYKCITQLKKLGYATQKHYVNQDERITYINITAKGRALLEEWGK